MAKNKKTVVIYCDIIHSVEPLTDEEAGKLFKHYLRYINDLNPVPEDRLTALLFEPIKQSLKRDLKKWEETKSKKSDGGKKGMEKRWGNSKKDTITTDNIVIEKDNIVTKNITPITVSVSDSVNVSVNDIEKENIINNKIAEILDSEIWLQGVAMQNKIDTETAKSFLSDFLNEQKLKDEIYHRDIKELRKHFINWLKIEIKKTNTPNKNGNNRQQSANDAIVSFLAD